MTCGKHAFVSEHEAKLAARRIQERKKSARLRPYKCRDCKPGAWHLTSEKKGG